MRATTGRSCTRVVPCTCETSRECATSRGSSPTPAESSTCSISSPPKARPPHPQTAARQPSSHARPSAMLARCSMTGPRVHTEDASPRSKPTLSRHANSATPIGRRRQHSNATSSSGSCHAPSASAVATEEPRQPPNVRELPSPGQPDTPLPTSRGTIASSAPTSILRPAPAHIAPTLPTRPRPRRGLTGYPPPRGDDGDRPGRGRPRAHLCPPLVLTCSPAAPGLRPRRLCAR